VGQWVLQPEEDSPSQPQEILFMPYSTTKSMMKIWYASLSIICLYPSIFRVLMSGILIHQICGKTRLSTIQPAGNSISSSMPIWPRSFPIWTRQFSHPDVRKRNFNDNFSSPDLFGAFFSFKFAESRAPTGFVPVSMMFLNGWYFLLRSEQQSPVGFIKKLPTKSPMQKHKHKPVYSGKI